MNRFIIPVMASAALMLAACEAEEDAAVSATDAEIESTANPGESEMQAELALEMDRSLAAAIASDVRSSEDKARDAFRHPLETLEFLGVEPGMTVVEIWPGLGYYMDIIAPHVAGNGVYVSAGFPADADSDYVKRINAAVNVKLTANPEYYGEIVNTVFVEGSFDLGPEGSADMVLTFRNLHNWMKGGYQAQAFDTMFKALKPGGILGVVEHRGNPDVAQDPKAESGYVNQSVVIEMAEAAGFQLVDSSEVNANPSDTKDYAKGVWTLPPTLRLGDEDKVKYQAIGESDRMTLKFMKPATTGMASN
ncbi:MAG: methyltransferase [Proteobacteria bacterium]|nr:methyltransferase [Pseudomonadota bacterium]